MDLGYEGLGEFFEGIFNVFQLEGSIQVAVRCEPSSAKRNFWTIEAINGENFPIDGGGFQLTIAEFFSQWLLSYEFGKKGSMSICECCCISLGTFPAIHCWIESASKSNQYIVKCPIIQAFYSFLDQWNQVND